MDCSSIRCQTYNMSRDDPLINRPGRPHFLVVLFGVLEYDGRVLRMVEVLSGLGDVTLVDVSRPGDTPGPVTDGIDRVHVQLPAGVTKMAGHLRFWWAALKACRRVKPNVVVAEDYFTAMPGWLSARLSRSHLIYDAHELIVPQAKERMVLRDRIWYLFERWVVPRAELVIAASPQRAAEMSTHYHLTRAPEFMRNIPSQRYDAMDEGLLLATYPCLMHRDADERIILYQGHMALSRGIGRFLEAMAHLPTRFRLVLAGGGPDQERIAALVRQLRLSDRVIQLGRIPNRQLFAITRACDMGIVAYPIVGLNNIYCAPNKVFEYAQAGLPVITTDQPPLKSMVERYQIGQCVGPEDPPGMIAKIIDEIAGRTKESYEVALAAFLDDHRWDNEAQRVRASIAHFALG